MQSNNLLAFTPFSEVRLCLSELEKRTVPTYLLIKAKLKHKNTLKMLGTPAVNSIFLAPFIANYSASKVSSGIYNLKYLSHCHYSFCLLSSLWDQHKAPPAPDKTI